MAVLVVPKTNWLVLLVRFKAAKVGEADELIFWTVLMVPAPLSVKLVELKVAAPLVEASALALAIEIVPAEESESGLEAETATVPEALGKLMVLVAVGEVKLRVVELAPELAMRVDADPPCKVRVWVAAPTVKDPPVAMLK